MTAPWCSTVIRVATENTTSMSCSVKTMVSPVSRAMPGHHLHDLVALARRHAGGGLVQQQEARGAGQRDGQLEPALVAVGEDAARLGRLLEQADPLEQRVGLVPVEAPGRHEDVVVPAVVGQERRQHVLERGEPAEDARDLKRAPHPAPAQLVRRQPAHLLAQEVHLARVVGEVAAQEVEERRLPRAVRPDDGPPIARRHRQVDAVDGLDAAEVLPQRDDVEDEGTVRRPCWNA